MPNREKTTAYESPLSKTSAVPMPVLFVGHGNPMNAIDTNVYSRGWEKLAREITPPKAILCVSAHWETEGSRVSTQISPRTIHDFYGFPQELYDVRYPCRGDPGLAEEVIRLGGGEITPDETWGIDHGTWSVLCRMYPGANIPVVQLSLDFLKESRRHFGLARLLAPLRERGVLIVGSGNLVHNLQLMRYRQGAEPYDWAVSFDETVSRLVTERSFDSLVEYHEMGREAWLSIPTNEHYLPLLYALATARNEDDIVFPVTGIDLGSVSMRSVRIG
jgi:4,5-DOPA dioxygenase extradiol